MALLINTVFKGLEVLQAYVSVLSPSISKDKLELTFDVCYSADNQNEPFKVIQYVSPYDVEGANPFAQAYTYLKIQPEFVAAIDG